MDFKSFPKTELHLHLDCSLSFELVHRLNPQIDRDKFLNDVALTEKVKDLADFLRRVPHQINLLQTEAGLVAAMDDLFDQLASENVIYAEIRYAPHQHLEQGLTLNEVVRITERACAQAVARTGVEGNLILCTLRHYSAQQAMETAELAVHYKGTRVVALDLAADEAGFPIEPQVAAFAHARAHGVHLTAHAGEACGPESVHETLEKLKPARIGHGVRAIEDPQLVNTLAQEQIHLEVCPACNVLIDVYDRLEDHPIDKLYKAGVPISINTDGRTLPLVSQTQQYEMLAETFGWGEEEFRQCARNALNAAFIDSEVRRRLLSRL